MSSFVRHSSFVLRDEHETLGRSYTKLMRKEMVEINIFPDMSQEIWWLFLAADVCISLQAKPCQKNNKKQKKLAVLPDLNEWERRSLSCRTKVMFIKLLNPIPFFSSALFLPAFVRLSSVYCKNKGLQRRYFLELLNAPLSPAPRVRVFVRYIYIYIILLFFLMLIQWWCLVLNILSPGTHRWSLRWVPDNFICKKRVSRSSL